MGKIQYYICHYIHDYAYQWYYHIKMSFADKKRRIPTWTDAIIAEWHVLLLDNEARNSLLSVPATELISDLRTAGLP